MSRILGVHGVGHQFAGENTIRAAWLPAVKDGLSLADRLIDDDDFACASYGTLFRPQGKSGIEPPLDALDVAEDWEQILLESWWREAASADPAVVAPDTRTKLSTPHFVQRALNALCQSRFFTGLAERALIYDLRQSYRYFHEPEIRQAAGAAVASKVTANTTVIIGHSLGSVVAYEALCIHPEWPVHTFVTIGSPLGISNLFFDKLRPSPESGVGAWPGNIKMWFNIADRGDIVALTRQLAPRFKPGIKDYLIDNGAKAHDATRYLTSREVGNAVASGL